MKSANWPNAPRLPPRKLGGLIRGIQGTVSEAVVAMRESANEVEVGVSRANNAGKALESIVTAADAVFQRPARPPGRSEDEYSGQRAGGAVDSVSAVIEENTAAPKKCPLELTK